MVSWKTLINVPAATAVALFLFFPAAALGQDAPDVNEGESTDVKDAAPAQEPFWPSDWMVKAWLNRSVNDVVRKHGLSEGQGKRLFDLYTERLPEFMEKNKESLQPVLNEMMSAALSGVAPSSERMAKLAKVAKPLVKEVRGLAHGVFDEFKEDLSPEQLVRMTGEMKGFDLAMKLAANRIEKWGNGDFDSGSIPGFRNGFNFTNRGSSLPPSPWLESGGSGPPKRVVAGPSRTGVDADKSKPAEKREKDRFTKYVEEFIARYDLDKAQRQVAMAILSEIKERAAPAESDSAARISRIEARERELAAKEKSEAVAKEEAAKERNALEERRVLAMRRVNRLFDELKKRLRGLPTSRQKRHAKITSQSATEKEEQVKSEEASPAPKP
jgi:hypothetical protein